MYSCMCVYVHIYIYRERERDITPRGAFRGSGSQVPGRVRAESLPARGHGMV